VSGGETILSGSSAGKGEKKDFLRADGILCCGNCGTPKQCRRMAFGRIRTLSCLCRCGQEAYVRRKAEEEEKERKIYIRRLRLEGIQDRYMREWRFEGARETERLKWARRYVENWKTVRASNLGILLWGEVGTGKSFLAACIANALLDQGIPVLMTNFPKILNQMGSLYREERQSYLMALNAYSLLIIDDLGVERNTEYAKEQVYEVIDERYKAKLPAIITTNLTIRELKNPESTAEARIYSRILEMCTPVYIGGKDRRKEAGRKKQENLKKMMEGEQDHGKNTENIGTGGGPGTDFPDSPGRKECEQLSG